MQSPRQFEFTDFAPSRFGVGATNGHKGLPSPVAPTGRERELADIAQHSSSDAAECAAADLWHEFNRQT